MLRSRGALQTSAKPRSCCWDRGLPAGGSSFYKNKAGLIQNPGNLSRLLAYASAALYRELQGKDWDRGCRSLQSKTASSHGLFANASMLSCWPFLGLVLAVSPSRAHTFIPHEPPAPNPSSEVHLVASSSCHNSTDCSYPLPVSENINVSPQQRSEAFSSQSDARSFPHPASWRALGICVWMRHNARVPHDHAMIMDGWKSPLHGD